MNMPAHLDSHGLFRDDPGSITTASGGRVNPLTLAPEDIEIGDLARSLAAQCRYNGHCFGHLSVARHSLLVADEVAPEHRLWALLHDAAEAYLGDLVRPLKHTAYGERYLEIEARVERAVAVRFGLPYPMPDAVRKADERVLVHELLHLRWSYDGDAHVDEAEWLRAVCAAQAPKLIGLMGYAQVGKDTVASFLALRGVLRIAFADALRDVLLATDPIIPKGEHGSIRLSQLIVGDAYHTSIGWDRAKSEYREVRELLQRLGTEGGRKVIGTNVWVDAALRKVQSGGHYVFTDVRFPNEADAIRAAGGQLWRVTRPGRGPVNGHASETALDDYPADVTLENDGTPLQLQRKVEEFLDQPTDTRDVVARGGTPS